jgi:phosphoribosylformimino-5-aminoimidazole carboxamide ribotide isomerase
VDLFPAIDIRAGRVVRLSQGEAARSVTYGDDPVAQAEAFLEAGASWIHVVDLDRAFGKGDNSDVVYRLTARIGQRVKLQVSGGLRSREAVRAVMNAGSTRVVVSTAAVTTPSFLPELVRELGADAIAIGLDARRGIVAVRGWVESTGEKVENVARRMLADGARNIIYTDVERDGMLNGPDIAGAVELQRLGARVVASGGVAKLDDLRAVRAAGLAGAIVGRAIYENRFTVAEALECC